MRKEVHHPSRGLFFLKRLEQGENEFESLIQTSDRSVPHVLKRAFYPDYPAALNAAVLRIKPSHNNSKSGLILKGIPRTSFVHSIHWPKGLDFYQAPPTAAIRVCK